MKPLIYLFLSLLLTAGTVFAQQPTKPQPRDGKAGVNLSLWKGLATQRTDSIGSTYFNIGIASHFNRLNGWSINLLTGIVNDDANGLQIAGISNRTGNHLRGLQIAGITNINGAQMTGASISGLVGIHSKGWTGMSVSGLVNVTGDPGKGVMIGGLVNVLGMQSAGVHIAGLANVSGSNHGVSVAGLLNAANEHTKGLQTSGVINVTAGNTKGVQVAGLGNVTGDTLCGVQIGIANMARRVKGLQIGLFNYYRDSLDGFQLGLINANPRTRLQLLTYAGNAAKLNVGVRFKNPFYYTILGLGSPYLDLGEKFSLALSYRAGLELPLYDRFFLSGDLGYQHVETFANKHHGHPARLFALQGRVNVEYRYNERFGFFLSTGYERSYSYGGSFYRQRALMEGGIALYQFR